MSDLKISDLPVAGTLVGTEPVAVVQAGVTKQTTVGAISGAVDILSLPDADYPMSGDDYFIINQGGVNKKVIGYDIFNSLATGRQSMWIDAAAMSPSAVGGCANLATIALAADRPDIRTLDFDPDTQEYAQFFIRMPKAWDFSAPLNFVAVWSHASGGSAFTTLWNLQAVALGNAESLNTAYGTAVSVTDVGGTANNVYFSPESADITISNTPQPEDFVLFRLSRVATDGADTLDIDARLHGITLFYKTLWVTDA